MAQTGLSEDVIINAVQTRGGRFDLSPNGLIYLKTNGVSDRVIRAVQDASVVATSSHPATSVIYPPQPSVHGVVVVHPRPAVHLGLPLSSHPADAFPGTTWPLLTVMNQRW
jgi:hypothetical protein